LDAVHHREIGMEVIQKCILTFDGVLLLGIGLTSSFVGGERKWRLLQ